MDDFVSKLIIALRALPRKFARDVRGGMFATFATALPVLFGAAGVAIDYVTYAKIKADLQSAADAAAIAGAREIQIAKSNTKQVTSAAISHAAYTLTGDSNMTAAQLEQANLTVGAAVTANAAAVQVDISEAWTPFFAHFLNSSITPVRVSATARFVGSANICVLGLSDKGKSVYLDKSARLTGNNCGVYSDSKDSSGFEVNSGATLTTSLNCVVGGSNVDSTSTISPKVLTACPVMTDPLASRPAPTVGGCDYTGKVFDTGNSTISPGVYCGGLKITNTANVTLSPGTYIIKDGDFEVSGQATAIGTDVSVFLTGSKSGKLNFTAKSHISFSAPETGPMAGLLFYEDRAAAAKVKHKITSDDARKLLGTIYLPVGDLVVDAKNSVADQSAWTAIIVQHMELNMGPNLVLNSNYSASNVPVPEGIKGTSNVVLTQ